MIKLNGVKMEQGKFPDGTLLIKYTKGYFPNENTIEWKYEGDAELFTLICLVKHLREHNLHAQIDLIMQYLPHARMDRVKGEEDIFTLKYFCEIINSLNFRKVYVTDAHSNVGLALLDKVYEIKPLMQIRAAKEMIIGGLPEDEELMVFFPDEGAMKRYSSEINIPFAFGIKRRDWETGKILGLDLAGEVDSIAGRNILIIDDICSRGGTFYHSAKALKEAGAANVYLYVTHCENTIHEGELLKEDSLIERIYTTNSLITEYHDKITLV